MKQGEVMLVFPQLKVFDLEVERATSNVFPLGLAYIAGALEAAEISVATVDMVTDRLTIPQLMQRVRKVRPRIVGIANTTVSFPRALEVATAIKAWDPEVLIVMGGVHVTVAYREVMAYDVVDVGVIGEGEQTMVEIVEAHRGERAFEDIRGIAFRRDGKVAVTPRRTFVRDLDTLASPSVRHFARPGELLDLYDVYPVCSGRGCTYTCSFCAAGALSGRAYRVRSPEHVGEEIRYIVKEYGVNHFFIVDDTFTAIPERAYAICDIIQRDVPGAQWLCECRTNSVSPHLLKTMADAGCYKLQFGIESGNQAVLNTVLKGTTLEQIQEAVYYAFEAGITEVVGSLIIGLPGETYQSALETIGFALKLKSIAEDFTKRKGKAHRFVPFLASLIPFPKVRCTTEAASLGIEILRDDPHCFISDAILTRPRGMSEKDIRELVMLGELVLQNLSLPGLKFEELWRSAGQTSEPWKEPSIVEQKRAEQQTAMA